MLESEKDVGRVELGCILLEATDLTQVEEKLATWAVLQAEVKLVRSLEREVHLHDKLVVYTFL